MYGQAQAPKTLQTTSSLQSLGFSASNLAVMDGWDGDDILWDKIFPPRNTCTSSFFKHLAIAAKDEYSSVCAFVRSVLTMDTVLIVAIAAASPCFFFYYTLNGHQFAYNESWTLIALFLVFPITMTMTSAFNRRDAALSQLALFKSNTICIMTAHCHWDWFTIPKDPKEPSISGREQRLPSSHVHAVYTELSRVVHLLRSILKAPVVFRLRHYYTEEGAQKRELVMQHMRMAYQQMTQRLQSLSLLSEEMKSAGLPANEATRIRWHFLQVINALTQLRFMKRYRNSLGLRAYARVFILVLPILFGPYYASLANATHIAFSISFSVAISLAVQGLFNLRMEVEDPFVSQGISYDTIDVDIELDDLEADLSIIVKETTQRDSKVAL
ncbi:hypothetical protein CEUSTIGMA_g1312.t1 [Chlamydomonas eustigma]|uniref:Uncharacterized protein n=1 Tax=Chlamydomonas eustigma TaxID=1157962 RepID=A0A250WT75_9CHLO|nr:hypothetical protein CEUSTIGMA_g1312.t1 [Chlamydomonas eustigma]|eukprot:GAX73862.1 hypothetical protein CEUSTIGMA_g1312.t1 [Chlamydomonas eustigma]